MNKKIRTLINDPSQIFRYLNFDTNDYRKTTFIAGSARSGTTWLQELVNYNNDYRVMFEPFDPEKVELISDWKFYQYLRTYETNPKFMKPMFDILSGNVKSNWIDRHNKRLISRKRLIKDINANLFLFWMKAHFPEIPVILIMRHPCAVANSKINIVGKHFRYETNPLEDLFLSQNELMEDFLYPFEQQINDTKTAFEIFIFMWCIENYVPIKQFQEGEIHITFYENLCVHPEKEIKKLMSFLGKAYSSKVIDKAKNPSTQSRKNSAIISGTDLIKSWRKNITEQQIQTAVEILNLFNLDQIYNDNNLPLLEGGDVLKVI